MATSFINATAKDVGATESVVYTVPGGVKAILIGCNLSNTTNSILPVSLFLRKSGGGDLYVVKNARIGNGENSEVMKGNKLVMQSGDQLVAISVISSAFDVIASILTGVS
jgi:hypothetical protein